MTVADNWATHGVQNGKAQAFSHGKGSSSVRAGPNGGSQASSNGTHGSGSRTAHKDHVHSVRDNWSQYHDKHGNRHATRDNWSKKRHSDNNAQARAYGWGKTAAVSNDKKSAGSGWGAEKADVESDFNQGYDENRDHWTHAKNRHGERSVRSRHGQRGETNTRSRAMGVKDADAATHSNRSGSRNSARGKKGSMAKSQHRNKEHAWNNSFDHGHNKHGHWNVGDNWDHKAQSHGHTKNMAKGRGWVAGQTDKDNGASASGKGTHGTMSDAGWGQ